MRIGRAVGALLFSSLWLGFAPRATAQSPAEIILLLSEPRRLEVTDLQTVAKAAFGVEFAGNDAAPTRPHLVLANGLCTLRWAGNTVEVASIGESRDLGAAALVTLDEEEQAQVRGHRAQLHVRIDGVLATPAAREAAYQTLGKLAAELLAADVVALGCSDHGTFELLGDGTVDGLREQGAFALLAPSVERSVVALLKAPRRWRQAELRGAAERAFGVQLPASAGPDDENFVVAKGGMVVVRIGERVVILTMRPERMDIDTSAMELRTRQAVDAHQAVLHMVTFGPPGDAGDQACYSHLGKLLAELWADDCLAMNWRTDPAVVCDADDLPARLRAKDPIVATLGQMQVPVLNLFDADAMQKAIATAREQFPEAAAWLVGGGKLFVKFPFPTSKGPGNDEHIWVEAEKVVDGKVKGRLGNDPVADLKLGSPVERPVGELSDWLYEANGKRHGGFSLAVLAAGAAQEPVRIATIEDVHAAVPKLAHACVVAIQKATGSEKKFATLGPLTDAQRVTQMARLAEAVVLQTERIEHGRASPRGYAAERALQLRQIGALASGRYWLVEMSVEAWHGLVYPQLADPDLLTWKSVELPEAGGHPRTLVFPLDLREAAMREAAANELANFVLALDALPQPSRAELLGEAVGKLVLPFTVGDGGLQTRIGTLPKGSRITAELRVELPK